MLKIKNILSLLFIVVIINGCAQQSVVEDVTTGLYDKDGMSYLDKDMTVPAKVYFDYNSYLLDADDEGALDLQVTWLDQNPSKYILIEGHCDERGTREYNLALGERRANSVKEYLVAMGISADRVNVVSYGKERPDIEGSYEAAWSKNRRGLTTLDVER